MWIILKLVFKKGLSHFPQKTSIITVLYKNQIHINISLEYILRFICKVSSEYLYKIHAESLRLCSYFKIGSLQMTSSEETPYSVDHKHNILCIFLVM